jgi:ubiquinone/menaquinone biosynthesis C-methylase UbiE
MEAQSLSVKRAQVEFHNFASFGQPEVVLADYAFDNERRGGILRKHADWIGDFSPFLEIGANGGHSSYMLANDFQADGFALDISADALRHGIFLMDAWQLSRAPIRMAGDAVKLPFQDNSLKFVMACQMLSQFMDIGQVFQEVHRVLKPGGVFFFTDEPIRRLLTLRLYRVPYEEQMTGWERKLHEWGVLGYVAKDVIGAQQEEGFGIRQNHRMYLPDWHRLIQQQFAEARYEIFPHKRGWGEGAVHSLIGKNPWRAARLLGGTLAALCRKAGSPSAADSSFEFETKLRCPDCNSAIARDAQDSLCCRKCAYVAPLQGGVYNLLASSIRQELYPGRRSDIIDFSEPGHEQQLVDGFFELEGVFGNKYRWVGQRCSAILKPYVAAVEPKSSLPSGPMAKQKLRVRGHAPIIPNSPQDRFRITAKVNGSALAERQLDRNGLFVLEIPLPLSTEYKIEFEISPVWQPQGDARQLTVNLSLIRLVPDVE